MADLIDRDAVLTEIGEFQTRFNETGDSHERVAYASAEHCMLVIKAAPAVNRWIPCAEKLPEVYEKVLTYSDEGIIHDNFRLNLRDGSIGWSQGWGITHWQPRPEPPEGGAGIGR